MTHAWRVIFAAIVLSLSLAVPSAAGPFEDAAAAFVKGDYVNAQRQFRSLADQGNAVAQYNLGTMYFGGQGVPQDSVEALKWFRLAAGQGHAGAENSLAAMYLNRTAVAPRRSWQEKTSDQMRIFV